MKRQQLIFTAFASSILLVQSHEGLYQTTTPHYFFNHIATNTPYSFINPISYKGIEAIIEKELLIPQGELKPLNI
ncbi:MAG: hypothetical protein K2G70_06775 [Turicibacter sp.]|nr:hypothetical protein [Turicibacter sp.]